MKPATPHPKTGMSQVSEAAVSARETARRSDGRFGASTTPEAADVALDSAPAAPGRMDHHVIIERQYSDDLVIGYATRGDAEAALTDDLFIDGLCEDDCLDAYTSAEVPQHLDEFEVVIPPRADGPGSEEAFEQRFRPHVNEGGSLLEFEDVKGLDEHHVWTVMADGGETDHWYTEPGFHVVNKMGYVTTEVPWNDSTGTYIWFEADEDEYDELRDDYGD